MHQKCESRRKQFGRKQTEMGREGSCERGEIETQKESAKNQQARILTGHTMKVPEIPDNKAKSNL